MNWRIAAAIKGATETTRSRAQSSFLTGTVSVVQSPLSVTANVAVYENGGGEPVAIIRGTADATHNGITITHQDGSQLSSAELEALDQLFELPDRLEEALEHLFHPAERFMGI